MADNPRALAIIPARQGSKRVPGKNTRLLAGKPLIQWSIEAAQQSACIDRVLVTSDDPVVLKLAEQLKVDHIIERPEQLATDTAPTADAIIHALDTLQSESEAPPDDICLLQATSPLRRANDIDGAMRQYRQANAPAVISVCELEHPLAWCAPLDADGKMTQFVKSVRTVKRSQEAPVVYRLNGAVFITSSEYFREHHDFLSKEAMGYVMPAERSVDIDNELDFGIAEYLLRKENSAERLGT